MNTTTTSNAATSLKGSRFYGEFYTAGKFDGHLYKLASGKFAVVQKAEYSGKVLSVGEPIEGRLIERFRTLDLGYSAVSMYRLKAA
jgi:hypothetical protein